MKISIHKGGKIVCEPSSVPVREKGEVLLKITACGICGSDVPRVFADQAYHYPIVLGHEFAGVVEESDNAALIGKRVCVFPLLPCGRCQFCGKEQYANCVSYDYYGSRRDGGMQDYLVVKEQNLVLLPDEVSDMAAAMTEPVAVTLHALKKAAIRKGERVLIYGAGTIGLLCGMWARAMGAAEVTVTDIDPCKLAFAQELGFLPYGGDEADVTVEASGAPSCLGNCIQNTRSLGRVIMVGNPTGDVTLSTAVYSMILRKQLQILGSWNSDFGSRINDWKESVTAMATGIISPEKLITHTFALVDAEKAFAMIRNREFYNKIMVVSK